LTPGRPDRKPPAPEQLPQASPAGDEDEIPTGEHAVELEPELEPASDMVLQATPVDGIPVVPRDAPSVAPAADEEDAGILSAVLADTDDEVVAAAVVDDEDDVVPAAVVEGVKRSPSPGAGISDTVFQSDEFLSKRYDMIRRVGKGGMSVVYLATDRQLRRSVAVKITRPFTDEETEVYTARFVNEARILARLNHPNIVHVYDFAASESGMRIIMEYVDGRTLYQRVAQDGPMNEVEVAAIACEVLDAIEVIHSEGVIHRDMKPGNVMLDDKGRVKVMDFGIAQTEGLDTDASSGSVVGTIKFMAPEQSRGETVTERSDLFSVGATMAFMLLGELPSVLRAEQLPPNLRPVLLQAMAADPAARFGSATAMREAIETAAREPQAGSGLGRKLLLLAVLPIFGVGFGLLLTAVVLFGWLGSDGDRDPGGAGETSGFRDPHEDVVSGGGMLVIEDEPETDEGAGGSAAEEEEQEEEREREEEKEKEKEREKEVGEEREREKEKEREERVVQDDPTPTEPVVSSDEKPWIKHPIRTAATDGDRVRFEVYVRGAETYGVSVTYRASSGGSWRTLKMPHRGDGKYTNTLIVRGDLAGGVAYYVTIVEESGPGRTFTRGTLNDPYLIAVD